MTLLSSQNVDITLTSHTHTYSIIISRKMAKGPPQGRGRTVGEGELD